MLVTVNQAHIDQGAPNVCGFCPVALALEGLTGVRWFVTHEDAVPVVRLCDPTYTHRLLPPEARAWVKAFDSGERVEPFAFQLDLSEFLPQVQS